MLKFPSSCKIRENLFHGGSIICLRSSFSDTLSKLHGWGVPVLERGSSGGLNSSRRSPHLWIAFLGMVSSCLSSLSASPTKRSTLGLDLYMWLAYRTFTLKEPVRLRWRDLYRQFGVNPAQAGDRNTVNDFRTKCLRELKKIEEAWPELSYGLARGALIVAPSTPTIPPVDR